MSAPTRTTAARTNAAAAAAAYNTHLEVTDFLARAAVVDFLRSNGSSQAATEDFDTYRDPVHYPNALPVTVTLTDSKGNTATAVVLRLSTTHRALFVLGSNGRKTWVDHSEASL